MNLLENTESEIQSNDVSKFEGQTQMHAGEEVVVYYPTNIFGNIHNTDFNFTNLPELEKSLTENGLKLMKIV